MSLKEDKKVYRDAVMEFRKKHYQAEMEENIKIAKSIRDNPEASARDRNEAIKTIARMVGGLTPDRTGGGKESSPVAQMDNKPLSDSDLAQIEALINETSDT